MNNMTLTKMSEKIDVSNSFDTIQPLLVGRFYKTTGKNEVTCL
jgi:hypothetical protein